MNYLSDVCVCVNVGVTMLVSDDPIFASNFGTIVSNYCWPFVWTDINENLDHYGIQYR